MMLGKLPARIDERTLKLSNILKEFPPVPEIYDIDNALGMNIPNPMFANDRYGDCVIAGRAHQTLRFEAIEQKKILPITDQDVTAEYFIQSGGADNGLFLLESLKDWRNDGWPVTSKITTRKILCLPVKTKVEKQTYTIYAFGAVDWKNRDIVKACIYLLGGLYTGILLPMSAQNQDTWDVDNGPDGMPGSWGGHCVYIKSYDSEGLTCITWGAKKKMTWGFLEKYCVAPETKILTADLRWIKAGEIKLGDSLFGFDAETIEYDKQMHRICRRWKRGIVEQAENIERPCYELLFDDGTKVRCSAEHRWLIHNHQGTYWVTTENLRCGPNLKSKIVKPLDVWNTLETYEAGYLAAAFDGEGSLTQLDLKNKPAGVADTRILFAQKENQMWSEVKRILDLYSFHYCLMNRRDIKSLSINRRAELLRFMGTIRPKRLLPKLNYEVMGKMPMNRTVKLVSKKDIGIQTVIAIKTDSATYLAEGLASHNCDEAFGIIDNKDHWLGDNSPLDIEKLNSYLNELT